MENTAPQRFLLIDILRGLAAFSVLIYHHQHVRDLSRGVLPPFYEYLRVLFEYGNWAVELFWVISGFVFFAVYRSENLTISGFSFFVRRFSRLYPLHFTTLVLIGLLQLTSLRLLGEWQIYGNNDLYHFVLNLFLASSWGFEKGQSFNGPIWSVSVEEVVYALFFVFCRFVPIRIGSVLVMLLGSGLGLALTGHLIFVSASLFYLGGTVFLVWELLNRRGPRLPVWLGAVWVLASVAADRVLHHFGAPAFCTKAIYFLSVFPGLVFFCASLERIAPTPVVQKFVWIGDITYSTYLLHVPVQIIALLLLKTHHVSRAVTDTKAFLVGYLLTVLLLGLLSYKYLERPAQQFLRTRILGARRIPAAAPSREHPPLPDVDASRDHASAR